MVDVIALKINLLTLGEIQAETILGKKGKVNYALLSGKKRVIDYLSVSSQKDAEGNPVQVVSDSATLLAESLMRLIRQLEFQPTRRHKIILYVEVLGKQQFAARQIRQIKERLTALCIYAFSLQTCGSSPEQYLNHFHHFELVLDDGYYVDVDAFWNKVASALLFQHKEELLRFRDQQAVYMQYYDRCQSLQRQVEIYEEENVDLKYRLQAHENKIKGLKRESVNLQAEVKEKLTKAEKLSQELETAKKRNRELRLNKEKWERRIYDLKFFTSYRLGLLQGSIRQYWYYYLLSVLILGFAGYWGYWKISGKDVQVHQIENLWMYYPKYEGQLNCLYLPSGKGTAYYPDSSRYEGEWMLIQPHGKGTKYWANGEQYTGDWRYGRRKGTGELIYAAGVYTGQWENNKQTGQGSMLWKNGERYEGQWKHGKRAGLGEMLFPDGRKYVGDWKEDKIQGQGTMTYSHGVYVGTWQDGKRHGKGVLTWTKGDKYDGQWKEDNREGKGTYISADGYKYEGDWVNNKQEGEGVEIHSNEDTYSGTFKNARRDGYGTYKIGRSGYIANCPECVTFTGMWENNLKINGKCYDKNGKLLYDGVFKNNKPLNTYNPTARKTTMTKSTTSTTVTTPKTSSGKTVSPTTKKYPDGDYKGLFNSKGERHGEGTFTWTDGGRYVGNWVNDVPQGQGKMFWKNGDKYDGEFKANNREGKGTYTWSNGDQREGYWKNGKSNGEGIYTVDLTKDPNNHIPYCERCVRFLGKWKDGSKVSGKCYDKAGKLIYDGIFDKEMPVGVYPMPGYTGPTATTPTRSGRKSVTVYKHSTGQ